jgi:hypothetical protein
MSPGLTGDPSRRNGAEGSHLSAQSADVSPDAIVAGLYYDDRRPSVCSDGEHRLMLAVLKTAICDYLQGCDRQTSVGRQRSAEVSAWINQKSTASGVFAFEEICESLCIDPDRLRKRLSSLAKQSMVLRLRASPVRSANQRLRKAWQAWT